MLEPEEEEDIMEGGTSVGSSGSGNSFVFFVCIIGIFIALVVLLN